MPSPVRPEERCRASCGCATSSFLGPLCYRVRIRPGITAEARGLRCERLVELTLAEALHDTRDVGQKIRPTPGELAKVGHRSGMLGLGELMPPSAVSRRTVYLRDEYPVIPREFIEHEF